VLVREFFSPKRTDFLFIEHRCFSFFAGDVTWPKRKPDHYFHFVTNLRMNGAPPRPIFYDIVTHTRTVFSVLFVLYDDLGSKSVENYITNRKRMYKLSLFLIIKPTRCTNILNLFL
jgi:hypothetical protein